MDKSKLSVGQRFNPFKVFNGVFVPDPLFYVDGLSDGARLCFGVLARFAGQDGRAYPSYERLALCLNRSRIQVMRRVRELVKVGLIEVEKTETTNRYYFLWHPIFDTECDEHSCSMKGRV
jgi:hypothetical protein